jgi:hypothetical protein
MVTPAVRALKTESKQEERKEIPKEQSWFDWRITPFEPDEEREFVRFMSASVRLQLVLIVAVLVAELVCFAVRIWSIDGNGITISLSVWFAVYVPLGAGAFFWIAAVISSRQTRKFKLPPYIPLLLCITCLSCATLGISVILMLPPLPNILNMTDSLIDTLCILPLVIHAQLVLLTISWRAIIVTISLVTQFVVWLIVTLVYTVPLLGQSELRLVRLVLVIVTFAAITTLLVVRSFAQERQWRHDYALRAHVHADREIAARSEAESEAKNKAGMYKTNMHQQNNAIFALTSSLCCSVSY